MRKVLLTIERVVQALIHMAVFALRFLTTSTFRLLPLNHATLTLTVFLLLFNIHHLLLNLFIFRVLPCFIYQLLSLPLFFHILHTLHQLLFHLIEPI